MVKLRVEPHFTQILGRINLLTNETHETVCIPRIFRDIE